MQFKKEQQQTDYFLDNIDAGTIHNRKNSMEKKYEKIKNLCTGYKFEKLITYLNGISSHF
jgi:hypothetical protein